MGRGGGYAEAMRHLRTLFEPGAPGAGGDAELVERIAAGGEGARRAFEAVVERHGPTVWGACRAILGDRHAAEDAFQATFLVLARRAGSLRLTGALGGWLHGVAVTVARRARADAAKRARREATLGDGAEAVGAREPATADPEAAAVVHEELAGLAAAQRQAIVLCHLQGYSHEQAAAALGWPVGTVRSRLARGRERLKSRLIRRGVGPAVGIGVAADALGVVPPALAARAVAVGTGWISGGLASSAGTVPAAVAALASGVVASMITTKLATAGGAAVLGLAALFGAASTLSGQDGGPRPGPRDGEGHRPAARDGEGVAAGPRDGGGPRPEAGAGGRALPTVRDDPAGRALPTVRDDPARAQPDHPRNVGLSPFEIESPTADREELDVRLAQARRRLAWAKEMAELGYLSPQGLQQAAREVENLEAQRRRAPGADRPEPTATETPTRAPESDGRDQEEATLLAARLQAERLQASRIERLFKDPLRLASSRDFELATEKVRETTARARGLLERYRGELRVLDARRKALQASREAAATLLAAAQEDAKEAATRAAQAVGTQAERRRAEAAVLERQADLLSREADLEENVIRGDQLRRGANVLVEALGPPPPAPSPGSPTVGEPVLPPRSR